MAVYPRKQTIIIFMVCAIAVLGVAYYVNGGIFTPKTASELQGSSLAVNPVDKSQVLDNGDWKKAFLDQTSAGNDSFKAKPVAKTATKPQVLSSTDALGRTILEKYATLNQAGITQDPTAMKVAASQLAAESLSRLPAPKTYELSDITTTINSSSTLLAYGGAVITLFKSYMPSQNEAIIAEKAFDTDDMSILKSIDPIIAGYDKLVSELSALSVPAALVTQHINLLNGVSVALYNAQSIRHIDTDPIRGLAGISLETFALDKIKTSLSSMREYFMSTGIEAGS